MSEQTANLCTTDACESLRARLAKYEDADGRPLVVNDSALREAVTPHVVEWVRCGLAANNRLVDGDHPALQKLRDALKTQPRGVVLPERLDIPHRDEFESADQYAAAVGEAKKWNACLAEVTRLNSFPVSAGEYGDAYQGAREDLAIWKRRALEAEAKIREQDQIIENLGNALNAESGPTFMGEPVVSAGAVDERAAFEALRDCKGFDFFDNCYWLRAIPECPDEKAMINADWELWQAATAWQRAALTASAPNHGEQVE